MRMKGIIEEMGDRKSGNEKSSVYSTFRSPQKANNDNKNNDNNSQKNEMILRKLENKIVELQNGLKEFDTSYKAYFAENLKNILSTLWQDLKLNFEESKEYSQNEILTNVRETLKKTKENTVDRMNVSSEKTVQETKKQLATDFFEIETLFKDLKISISKQNEQFNKANNNQQVKNDLMKENESEIEKLKSEISELKKEKTNLIEKNKQINNKMEENEKELNHKIQSLKEKHEKEMQQKTDEISQIEEENKKKIKKMKQKQKEELEQSKAEIIQPKEGWLTKQGAVVKNWKKRWFVTEGNVLKYFKSPKDKKEAGSISLNGSQIFLVDGSEFWFSINTKTGERNFQIKASSKEEMEEWMEVLQKMVNKMEREMSNSSTDSLPIF